MSQAHEHLKEILAQNEALRAALRTLINRYITDGKLIMVTSSGELPIYWRRAIELLAGADIAAGESDSQRPPP